MIMGIALLIGALSLFLWNRAEENRAEEACAAVLPQVMAAITAREEQVTSTPENPDVPLYGRLPEKTKMTEVKISGNSYIGYLSVPSLDLSLPIISQWDYAKLKTAPCRYSGSTLENNMVIIGHNYRSHFTPLHQLCPGDIVLFTDMDGAVTDYRVVAIDVVHPTATREVTSGDFDLSLVTCTYSGRTRLVVYCDVYKN